MLAAIIVAYRSRAHLEANLPALAGELPAEAALVVWDNASGDGAIELVGRLEPSAIAIPGRINAGFAAAVNGAAAQVPGHDLLLINPDARVEPGAVAALVATLDRYPELAVVGGRVDEDGQSEVSAWAFPTAGRAIFGAVFGLGRAYAPREQRMGALRFLRGAFVPFTFVLLRRTAFDALRGLDGRFWLYGEDADYCFRAERAGWGLAVNDLAVVAHTGRASSPSRREARAAQLRSEHLFRRLHSGRIPATAAAAAMVAGGLGRLSVARLAGADPDRVAQWSAVVRNLGGAGGA